MTKAGIIQSVNADQLSDVLKELGYRVNTAEQGGIVQLTSASQGIGFFVRFGNPAAEPGHFLDYTFSVVLRIEGELSAAVVAAWNQEKRFSRLTLQGQFLVLEMDVLVAGGVTQEYLRVTTELWDHLIQQYLIHLRNQPVIPTAENQQAEAPATDEASKAGNESATA